MMYCKNLNFRFQGLYFDDILFKSFDELVQKFDEENALNPQKEAVVYLKIIDVIPQTI